ncbi:metallopeptidase TldD-related protein [Longispora sp. K20-0274]|uniref:TldD/PmbA family protein n=1 Tax=Longispora sp. K20-0274 TaxID=3088255 RepID=UPI0039996E7E
MDEHWSELVRQAALGLSESGADHAESYLQDLTSYTVSMDAGTVQRAELSRVAGLGVALRSGARTQFTSATTLTPSSVRQLSRGLAAYDHGTTGYNSSEPERDRWRKRILDLIERCRVATADWEGAGAGPRLAVRFRLSSSFALSAAVNLPRPSPLGLRVSHLRLICELVDKERAIVSGRASAAHTSYVDGAAADPTLLLGAACADAMRAEVRADAPAAGDYAVVLSPAASATFLHETVTHLLEADTCADPRSVLHGRKGSRITPMPLSVSDSPAAFPHWGSYSVDSEGIPAEEVLLVDQGTVRDTLRSRGGEEPSNGHGRRMSFQHTSLPRSTTTVTAAGSTEPAEMRSMAHTTIVVDRIARAAVDPVSGRFSLRAPQSRLVRAGREIGTFGEAVFSGRVTDALDHLVAIGSDPEASEARCGKGGQILPISMVAPSLAFSQLRMEPKCRASS